MLKINKLNAKIDNKEILKEFSLDINPGEVHAIMGPNGCLLYTSPSPRDGLLSRMPSSA